MTKKQLKDEAIGAVARGWTHNKNSAKEMDTELAEAIVQEVLPIITKAYEEGKREVNEKIEKITIEKPEYESDEYDNGRKDFRDELFKIIK